MTREQRWAFWRSHLEVWAGGDESQAAYCRRHGLSRVAFSQWKRRFERERLASPVDSADSSAAGLVEVRVAGDGARAGLECQRG